MICFKRFLSIFLCFLILPAAQGSLINLGVADKYTFAVGQFDYYGTPVGGTLNLGSDAWIYGDVAASSHIGFGSGSIIHGNACAPNINKAAKVEGISDQCSDVIKQNGTMFDKLSLDIAAANEQAALLNGVNIGEINESLTFQASDHEALAISSINLDTGEYLTINGSANDNIVLNIAGNALIGSGAGILLTGGLTSQNVFFNFIMDEQALFNFGGAIISGTFIANNGAFIAGDGAQLNDVRFYTNNALIANVQEVRTSIVSSTSKVIDVPEPSTLLILLMGIFMLLFNTSASFRVNTHNFK